MQVIPYVPGRLAVTGSGIILLLSIYMLVGCAHKKAPAPPAAPRQIPQAMEVLARWQ